MRGPLRGPPKNPYDAKLLRSSPQPSRSPQIIIIIITIILIMNIIPNNNSNTNNNHHHDDNTNITINTM